MIWFQIVRRNSSVNFTNYFSSVVFVKMIYFLIDWLIFLLQLFFFLLKMIFFLLKMIFCCWNDWFFWLIDFIDFICFLKLFFVLCWHNRSIDRSIDWLIECLVDFSLLIISRWFVFRHHRTTGSLESARDRDHLAQSVFQVAPWRTLAMTWQISRTSIRFSAPWTIFLPMIERADELGGFSHFYRGFFFIFCGFWSFSCGFWSILIWWTFFCFF